MGTMRLPLLTAALLFVVIGVACLLFQPYVKPLSTFLNSLLMAVCLGMAIAGYMTAIRDKDVCTASNKCEEQNAPEQTPIFEDGSPFIRVIQIMSAGVAISTTIGCFVALFRQYQLPLSHFFAYVLIIGTLASLSCLFTVQCAQHYRASVSSGSE